MTLFILAYLSGVLTIATPCVLPVLPFVLARTEVPFRRGSLPMLFGLAFAFAAVASLASFAGEWALKANQYGRIFALALLALFGLAMLLPTLAVRMNAPIVLIGSKLSSWVGQRTLVKGPSVVTSMLLGIATGLVWAPCAGPVLGLILSGAALQGPGVKTSLLLLTYALGAATSLAAGAFLGGRLLAIARRSAQWGEDLRRVLGAAVVASVAIIWFGLDTGFLTRLSSAGTNILEQDLITTIGNNPAGTISMAASAAPLPVLPSPLGSLLGARQWLNTQPLHLEDLRGKVVLVNFWTYSCVNCLRVLPYIRAWAEKYKDRGLVTIGVHTPEFAFEKDVANVSRALVSLGIGYPVAIDNDFGIWQAFDNQGWPALYFFSADGRIRQHMLGEGGYDRSERLIQRLLSEANGAPVPGDIAAIGGRGPQAAADEKDLGSAETYIGYSQAENFVSSGGIREDARFLYRAATALSLNQWSLTGVWTIGGEFATLDDTIGRITYRFHARDLNLVLAPFDQGHPIRFRVKVDGAPPGADHGFDVDADGWGRIQEPRLYQLIRQTGLVTDRTFEIEFFDAGVRAYSFTFG
jgi:cytochrome c biogenesis protein CcdA/thiol-disulfide isomerase/thioredoxin